MMTTMSLTGKKSLKQPQSKLETQTPPKPTPVIPKFGKPMKPTGMGMQKPKMKKNPAPSNLGAAGGFYKKKM